MKKIIILFAAWLIMLSANAQTEGDYDGVYLDDGIELNGAQWHYDGYSIMGTNDGTYVVVNANEYYYQDLIDFHIGNFVAAVHQKVLDFRPYVYNGVLGWFVRCPYSYYFCYPTGRIVRLRSMPVVYPYYYDVCGHRYLSFRHWHWYSYYRPYHRPPVHRPPHARRQPKHQAPPPPQHAKPKPQPRQPNNVRSSQPSQRHSRGSVTQRPKNDGKMPQPPRQSPSSYRQQRQAGNVRAPQPSRQGTTRSNGNANHSKSRSDSRRR